MVFELIYDVVGELSPMYFYLSIIFSLICSYQIMNMNVHHSILSNYDYTKECHAVYIKLLPKNEPISQITEIHNWITHTTKRIDAPDDDTDDHSFSLQQNQILRGGQQWRKNLYSLLLKNIV
ncbi:hypothetical protein [Virgibacillus siamensis]|uniref:hypothetical protein n=1 Tax=Virgibacillus siamensis TaxID=480071 RepID=UPI0009866B9F|nr:hypothetical protein [Virgibacillus siamensis]